MFLNNPPYAANYNHRHPPYNTESSWVSSADGFAPTTTTETNTFSEVERPIYWHIANASEQTPSHTSICIGCGQEIFDRYILRVAPDLEWHASCLRCVHCHRFLDESCTTFIRDGKPFCKADYVRLFGAKCAKCGQCFTKNDCVMRAKERMYHMECFRCVYCHRKLMPGDEFALRHDEIYCRNDHEMLLAQQLAAGGAMPPIPLPMDPGGIPPPPPQAILSLGHNVPSDSSHNCSTTSNGSTNDTNNNSANSKNSNLAKLEPSCDPLDLDGDMDDKRVLHGADGFPIRDVCSSLSQHHPPPPPSSANTSTTTTGGRFGGSLSKKDKKDKSKTTRIRTVLNERQLQTLRSCYQSNPRPDALIKEQLVELTGLNPRVIRVWFQNKRCKDKKRQLAIKNMQQQAEKNQALAGVRLQGIGPLIVTPGAPHSEQMGQLLHTVDVQQMQQSPAMWTPLQPNGEMDGCNGGGNAFQQLMHGFGENSDSHLHQFGGGPGGLQSDSQFDTEIDSFSPGMAGSDLSSASCSD